MFDSGDYGWLVDGCGFWVLGSSMEMDGDDRYDIKDNDEIERNVLVSLVLP